jgi:hypothetical protein
MGSNIYVQGDYKPFQQFVLQNNGILRVITHYGYIASMNQRIPDHPPLQVSQT